MGDSSSGLPDAGYFPKYPKIDTLFARDPDTFKVREWESRREEFLVPSAWRVTEKIDGTNIRVGWDGERVYFGGRTDRAHVPQGVLAFVREVFTQGNLEAVFGEQDSRLPAPGFVFYGEGYGPGIQKGGCYRSEGQAFRLFDVLAPGGFWLAWSDVVDVAWKIGVKTAPDLGLLPLGAAIDAATAPWSYAASEDSGNAGSCREGVVARSEPLLLDRRGRRLIWKLKRKDF